MPSQGALTAPSGILHPCHPESRDRAARRSATKDLLLPPPRPLAISPPSTTNYQLPTASYPLFPSHAANQAEELPSKWPLTVAAPV